jgi:hypothetical protein
MLLKLENVMNEHRRQILDMLASGKITADETERLLSALETTSGKAAGDAKCLSGDFASYENRLAGAAA